MLYKDWLSYIKGHKIIKYTLVEGGLIRSGNGKRKRTHSLFDDKGYRIDCINLIWRPCHAENTSHTNKAQHL